MNIFMTDPQFNTRNCATMLDDVRLNKMILETAQILCTTARDHFEMSDDVAALLYKPTHHNHPSVKFARSSELRWHWLNSLFIQLHNERVFRTGKSHLSFTKFGRLFRDITNSRLPTIKDRLTFQDADFAPYVAIKDSDKSLPVYIQYRAHMQAKWFADTRPTWTRRGKPDWFI